MPYSDIYLYSPLSIKTVGHNQPLLLQFILSELFYAMDADKKDHPLEFVFSSPACFFPYDWCYEVGCLNKICEHAELLPHAFPTLASEVGTFDAALKELLTQVTAKKGKKEKIPKSELLEGLNELYTLLEPFLIFCSQSEHLLLFLLKHKEEIDEIGHPGSLTQLLKKIAPEQSVEMIQREFQNRGFQSLIPEIDRLLSLHEC